MVIVVNRGYMLCYYLEKFWCKSYKNNLFLNFVVLLMMEQIKITSGGFSFFRSGQAEYV